MKWIKKNKTITYSKNVFIPITNICRNNCLYCSFREDIKNNNSYILKKESILKILKNCHKYDIKEVLFTFGEYPDHYPEYKS